MGITVFGEWTQGASHNRLGIEWQDHYRKIDYIKGIKVLSVADGHGSDKCPYSADGAKLATKVFCNLMVEYYKSYPDLNSLMTFLTREGEIKLPRTIDMAWKEEVLDLNKREKRDDSLSDEEIIMMYGTTLLGLMITDTFVFALQIGDGDIIYVDKDTVTPVIDADKLLGVETHSLSSKDAWKKAVTAVSGREADADLPYMYLLSTDGFANSFLNTEAHYKTCREYYDMIRQHGIRTVREHLKDWLSETSAYGCGDDITTLFAYAQ
ncbi:MAG: protein phosphatase 2C domain-containing protein [Lachnospiraceae bacterium]|nr:protein phosphatase 2C domain-containing protein [Lachnospiraceae bacterium]